MREYAILKDHLDSDLGLTAIHGESTFLTDLGVTNAFKKALADSFYKKLCPMGNTETADKAALEKFERINASISVEPFDFKAINEPESLFWDYFRNHFRNAMGLLEIDEGTEGYLIDSTTYVPKVPQRDPDSDTPFGVRNYDLDFIRAHMGIGPGAAQKADSSTFSTKLFNGEMSYCNTDYLVTIYRAALSSTGLWADAEMRRFQEYGLTCVRGGKLFFAPKNAEISRTCCTEANLNMIIQKSLGAFCENRLLHTFGISLSKQPDYNRELTRKGSIDGSFGTIDLISASDSISLRLFDAIMEPGFTKAMFMMSRSESAVLPDGREVGLNMISTMGNGFTFPLQTIIFACAVRSVYQLMGFPCSDPSKHFGVFGDDIVVRRETYDFLCRMLNRLGFEVNDGKSFNTGPFRESCGEDYYSGVNIRGVYVRSLETVQQVCSCINRLTRWSARSGIWLPKTLALLRSWLGRKICYVPPSEADDAGIHVPFRMTKPRVTDAYWFHYWYYKRRNKKLVIPEPDDSPNPPGYGLSFLSGHTRRPDSLLLTSETGLPFGEALVTASLRDRAGAVSRYKVARAAIPYWDWPGERFGGDPEIHLAWESMMMASNFTM